MDLLFVFSVLSVIYCWDLCAVLSAPTGETPAARHVRVRRCSCASFMDKECVYFCHLDIIWVNTPERIVSYGLGNAPRSRRALSDSTETRRAPRCRCARAEDAACGSFCGLEAAIRAEHAPDAARAAATRKHAQAAAAAGRVNRRISSRISEKTRLSQRLLEKWRVR